MSRFSKVFRAAALAAATAGGASSATAQVPAFQAPTNFAPLPDVSDILIPQAVLPTSQQGPTVAGPVIPCPPNPCLTPGQIPTGQIPPNYNYNPLTTNPGTSGLSNTIAEADGSGFAGGRGRGAGAGPTSVGGGYIDSALPLTQFRLRYDSAYGNNRPDRAEFFYAKCGCFFLAKPPQLDAQGPIQQETNIDYQELSPYLEYAVTQRFSVFANIPIRFLNPDANANTTGLSDVSFGAKYAVVYNEHRVVTIQLRAITPTGGTREGLGTGNWWVEPGILFLEQLSPRWQAFGEFRGQFFTDRQSDFTGHVLRYGVGSSYMAVDQCWGYVAPVVEFVGWTALSGQELTEIGAQSARGDTIVNAKLGVRIGLGERLPGPGNITKSDLYVGYGRALTGEVWYKDMLRVEYRRFF